MLPSWQKISHQSDASGKTAPNALTNAFLSLSYLQLVTSYRRKISVERMAPPSCANETTSF